MVFKKRLALPLNRDSKKGGTPARLLWRAAWLLQFLFWGFLIFFLFYHWFVETPTMQGYYDAGLERGFDGLAGVAASLDPTFEELKTVKGRGNANRFTRLTGECFFAVWHELDEMPSWNAGLAKLRFDQDGRLLWVRRYFIAEQNPEFADENTSGARFSIVPSWSAREGVRAEKPGLIANPAHGPATGNSGGGRP
jgi:hypothetical protein